MKRLVLLVEGDYDPGPVANLVNRIRDEQRPDSHGTVIVDDRALVIGELPALSARCKANWLHYVQLAAHRNQVGGLLAVLDGDQDLFEGWPFCATEATRTLATRAADAGAGKMFSLAVVILRKEFEALLIAAAPQLPGFDGGPLPADIEGGKRGAKRWLRKHLEGGYKESADQLRLTQAISDFTPLRRLRSYIRLEHAVVELIDAIMGDTFVLTPPLPPPVTTA